MSFHATDCQGRVPTWLSLVLVMLSIIACSSSHLTSNGPTGRSFTEADVLFHRDPRWLGADAALSVPLASGRTLWLFGDTFIAESNAHVRSESKMVSNTVAIQTGEDPRTASITFHRSIRATVSSNSENPSSGGAV